MAIFTSTTRLRFAAKIAGIHFGLSVLVAFLLALLVFFVWYPFPYRDLMGSFRLFWLVVGIDICCGPLLTLILSSPTKSLRERVIDMSLVVLIQLAAFAYGMYSVYAARPVVLVFEVDRLRVLSALDILHDELPQAPEGYRELPKFSMLKVATKISTTAEEKKINVEYAMMGYDLGQRPSLWLPYEQVKPKIMRQARSLGTDSKLLSTLEQEKLALTLKKEGLTLEQRLFYLPLTSSRSLDWLAILDEDMQVLSAVEIDAFTLSEEAIAREIEQP